MLAKAALMGDEDAFVEIERATEPRACKALGRGVRGFDQALWDLHLEEVAFEVVRQKFESCAALRAVLLSTGDAVLAEAAPNDCIWGIGLGTQDDRALHPAQWCGRNVLGIALMRTRSHLRGQDSSLSAAKAALALPDAARGAPATGPAAEEATPPEGTMALPEADEGEDFLRPIEDPRAVRDCFERYGVVGVTGVLSAEECEDLIGRGLEPLLPEGCRLCDPATHGLADGALNAYGVLGKTAVFSPAICTARLHPNVVAAYVAVHGHSDVVAGHDRAAWMRPTALNAAWDTPFSWPGLHLDISPASYFGPDCCRAATDEFLRGVDYDRGQFVGENNAKHHSMGRSVQGVLNLLDNSLEDGGFQCVPGTFGERLKRCWVDGARLPPAEANGRYVFARTGADAELGKRARRVPCPAGTLILFDATLPHGTRPNRSVRSRAILFLRYITPDELPPEAWQRRNAALRRIVDRVGFEPDERQARHLFGPEPAAVAPEGPSGA